MGRPQGAAILKAHFSFTPRNPTRLNPPLLLRRKRRRKRRRSRRRKRWRKRSGRRRRSGVKNGSKNFWSSAPSAVLVACGGAWKCCENIHETTIRDSYPSSLAGDVKFFGFEIRTRSAASTTKHMQITHLNFDGEFTKSN